MRCLPCSAGPVPVPSSGGAARGSENRPVINFPAAGGGGVGGDGGGGFDTSEAVSFPEAGNRQ